jgi:hypothetical protein
MRTKLTLRLDEDLIQRAKPYAKKRSKPVSQIVADHFTSLGKKPKKRSKELTPIVRPLKGVLRGTDVAINDCRRHLEERHL